MKFFDRVAAALLKPANEVITFLIGVYTILWGAWVWNPFWTVFEHTQLYSQFLDVIPFEWVWGLLAIIAGVLTLIGLLKHLPAYIVTGASAASIFWFVVAVFYFIGDFANTGGITALFLAVLSAYLYLNCKLNNKNVQIWDSITVILHLKKK